MRTSDSERNHDFERNSDSESEDQIATFSSNDEAMNSPDQNEVSFNNY